MKLDIAEETFNRCHKYAVEFSLYIFAKVAFCGSKRFAFLPYVEKVFVRSRT